MESEPRLHEATARQCLADAQAAAGVHGHAGPDRRELVLNELVERALHAYEGFRRFEEGQRQRDVEHPGRFDPTLRHALDRTAKLHLQVGRELVGQLDDAVPDRLTVRNALAFRQAYGALVSLEALDHGQLPLAMTDLALAAEAQRAEGSIQAIDPEDNRNGVRSLRTWEFVKQTAALDGSTQALAEKRYRTFFALDDRHPALRGRPLFGGRRGETPLALWSVEISFDHRAFALIHEPADAPRCYVWFWIGTSADCFSGG